MIRTSMSNVARDQGLREAGRETIRLLVVDDHELIRRGVRHLIAEVEDVRMAGEARTLPDAVSIASRSRADVAILDLSLPGGTGPELCGRLREQGIRCLVLTSFIDEHAIVAAILAGADGFLPKHASGSDLLQAIRDVAAGTSRLDDAATGALVRHFREGRRDRRYTNLTSQERLVLALLAEGLTNRQIAERTRLAEKTVRNYVSRVLSKLGVRHRTEAALYAARHIPPAGV